MKNKIYIDIQTHIHTRKHTYTHTHIHTYTQPNSPFNPPKFEPCNQSYISPSITISTYCCPMGSTYCCPMGTTNKCTSITTSTYWYPMGNTNKCTISTILDTFFSPCFTTNKCTNSFKFCDGSFYVCVLLLNVCIEVLLCVCRGGGGEAIKIKI